MVEMDSGLVKGLKGGFAIHKSVLEVIPKGQTLIAAEKHGTSAWARTARLTLLTPGGKQANLFYKCITGKGARGLTEGEYESAVLFDEALSGFSPKPVGWGQYMMGGQRYYFYVSQFHDMDLARPPHPAEFARQLAIVHREGTSPNGMFGFHVPTVNGIMERTVTWESSWAASFTHQLNDVIRYDNATNGVWPELDIACQHLIDVVIPRLLGALQSDGRSIKPSLIHGDLWENNVGIDKENGKIVVFDPGCTYSHNEMEFGLWRCMWSSYFSSPAYIKYYLSHNPPSEPQEEFDDRNRLYSIQPHLGYPLDIPETIAENCAAFNDILYLCEKYGSIESIQGIGRYDQAKDVNFTGERIETTIKPLYE